MRKPMNLTAALTAAGVLLFLAPALPAQSSGGMGGSNRGAAQSGQSGSRATSSHSQTGKESGSAKLTPAGRKFVTEAAQGGLAEVELGNLAAEKASNSQVKEFGQKMVRDHSDVNAQLKDIASREGINLPTEPSAQDKAVKNRLSKLSGSEFDHAYMRQMEKDHNKDIAEFKKASEQLQDPALKQFAQKTLPILEEHDRMAHQTMAAIGGTNRGKASGMSADEPSPRPNTKPMGEQPPTRNPR